MLVFKREFHSSAVYSVEKPTLSNSTIDTSTVINSISVISITDVYDDYVKNHGETDESVTWLTNRRADLPINPVRKDSWTSPVFIHRLRATFAVDEEKYNSTAMYQVTKIDHEAIAWLGRDAFLMRGGVDQRKLENTTLYSEFTAAISRLDVPDGFILRQDDYRPDAKVEPIDCNADSGDEYRLYSTTASDWVEPIPAYSP